MEHHPQFSPSSGLPRAALCPGSVGLITNLKMRGLVEDGSSPVADEGTLLHSRLPPEKSVEDLTSEQAYQIDVARRFIASHISLDSVVDYEASLSTSLAIGPMTLEQLFGTTDCVIRDHQSKIATIIDLKFGRQEPSETFLAVQGSAYALMALSTYDVVKIHLHTFHPRLGYHYQASYSADDIVDLRTQFAAIIQKTREEHPVFQAGVEQCTYCPALKWCHAAMQTASFALTTPEYDRVLDSPTVLSRNLRLAKFARLWADKVIDDAKELLASGVEIPGWSLKRVEGDRQIQDPSVAYEALAGTLLQGEFLKSVKVFIPQLEKLFVNKYAHENNVLKSTAKEVFDSLLKDIITRKDPEYHLVMKPKEVIPLEIMGE